MSAGKQPYAEEGYALMGAAFEVHNEIGGGLAEFELRGIPFRPRTELKVFYKQRELSRRYIPDLVVYERVIVELKAVSGLLPEHEGQLMNYMRLARSPIGYLINFGPMGKLDYKRIIISTLL